VLIFQLNFTDGDSAYDATKTTTVFEAQHDEADSSTIFLSEQEMI
jgi:hypothetical protein